MLIEKYLVISATKNRYGSYGSSIRLVEKVPTLKGNEISLRLKLNIPNAVFERPQLTAEMTVPDNAVSKIAITPEVADNIEKIIKEATGLTINVTVAEHPEEKK